MIVAASALPIGVAAALQPTLAVTAVLGLVLLPVLLARPIIGLAAVVFFGFAETFAGVTGALSLTKIVGVLLVLAWVLVVASAPPEDRAAGLVGRQPWLAAALLLFAAWASISIAWAPDPHSAENSVFRYLLNFVLFPIAFVAIRRGRDVSWLFAVFIAAALVSVVVGMSQGSFGKPGETARLQGAGVNPNQLGSYLMVSMVFAATFFANRRSSALARWSALIAGGLAGVSLFLTLSRGALLGLGAALLVAPFAVGRGRRAAALALIVLTAAGTTVWFVAFASGGAVSRITNPGYGGGSGRADLWRVGWRMVRDHPIQGVGAGNFGIVSPSYVLRPGATQRDKYTLKNDVPHNIYLNVLSELGILGLLLFVGILAISLRSALLAARAFAARGDPTRELLARALFISLVGLLVTDFFSSALYSKQLWFLLAAGPALLALAHRKEADEGAAATWLIRRLPGGAHA